MHLKTLTLRGFKSFASATTLRFEPGITCVVGPNGSGKSNVVDALTWVMGEQGAKSLRGGKMEDVIFAGTSGRAPLGRAEVSLTIDNTDGALPIDYSEVTISRTMFRAGGSEYAINGSPARLLDIQELLSDSGIGREMHVVVGQGQLDGVLRATPEERRGFIEEAAGVLKHRRRKEKALRKLEAMDANLTRLADLTTEIRRQLGPLGRQAEVARTAATVQADVRDARARLLADDLVQLTSTLAADTADSDAARRRREALDTELVGVRDREATLEAESREAAPTLARAQETFYALTGLRDRLDGTATLAADRARLLAADEPDRDAGPDPEELAAQAVRAREAEAEQASRAASAERELDEVVQARTDAEAAADAEEKRLTAVLRAAADRREGLARLAGQVGARRSRVEAGEAEAGRLETSLAQARSRHDTAQQEFTALEGQVAGAEEGEEDLDSEHEAASAELAEVEAELTDLTAAVRAAERDRDTWSARKDALELGLARKDGTAALLAAGDGVPGVLGSVATLLGVESGHEPAVAAALAARADAVAVASPAAAAGALEWLRDNDGGRAQLVIATEPAATTGSFPDGARPAREVVEAPAELSGWADRVFARVALVADLAAAQRVLAQAPELTVVTADGDVLAVDAARGGAGAAPSLLEVQAAVDEAADRLSAAVSAGEQARFAMAAATDRATRARDRVEAAVARLHDSDARLAAVAEQLGSLGSAARAARSEADRLQTSLEAARQAIVDDTAALAELTERLAAAERSGDDDVEPSTQARDDLQAAARDARSRETEARLALRTAQERVRSLTGRAQSLERSAAAGREARIRAAERAQRRQRQLAVARDVEAAARRTLDALGGSLATAAELRAEAEAARTRRQEHAGQVRERLSELTRELAELTDTVHRDEVARAEQRLRVEQLQQKASEELGTEPDVLMAEFGPDRPVPVLDPDADPGAEPELRPYVREEQRKRLRSAERKLAQLGKVNPLALEEFAALEERHQFLADQLEDLRSSRRDLLDIVREVDERVEQVFTAAWHDTEAQFSRVFARLFPGGEGRLILTDPSNMLTTGIEVEARPPGKKVKRLSLLSGGERSLTAVALLVAIFKARPSPFYVMDEVEAALDDTNLGRLLVIMEELRESSQLIVITHQKRTMEVADALYGVTMRGDGVTTVVSQRLREGRTAAVDAAPMAPAVDSAAEASERTVQLPA